jgi:hypothetical protein
MNKSKEIASKTATQAIKTGKDVGSFAKKKAGDIADDINEVANAEDKQKAIAKIANKTAADAVSTGKNVGSFAKKKADAVVQLATSEDTQKAIASTKKAVVASTKSAIKIVDKKADKYIPQTKQNIAINLDKAGASINPIYKDAKRKISENANKLHDWGNKKTLEIAHAAGHKILDKAGSSMARAAGSDPDMPNIIRSTIKSTVDDVVKDIKIQMDENLELMIKGTEEEYKQKILANPPDCCCPNPYHWFKAWILYTMFPHDKSIWAQLKNPWYYVFTIISLFPFGVSQVWWVLMFILRDKHDEYQLVNFIVSIKIAGFISVGVIPTFLGVFTYLSCANNADKPCSTHGPGMVENFLFTNVYFLVQIACVYICAILLICSKDKGARVNSTGIEEGDRRGRRRFCYWVMYDLITIILVGVLIAMALSTYTAPLSNTYIFWIKVVYGWLSIPWFILKLPLMFPLILHTHPSAYNPEGHCVAYANAKERDENREARMEKYGNTNCCSLYCCCCFGKSNAQMNNGSKNGEDKV